MKDYHINIFYSDEDKCYIADVPDLQFCSAWGNTPEEALRELQIAKAAWLEVARESGKAIPEPNYRPRRMDLPRLKKRSSVRAHSSKAHRGGK